MKINDDLLHLKLLPYVDEDMFFNYEVRMTIHDTDYGLVKDEKHLFPEVDVNRIKMDVIKGAWILPYFAIVLCLWDSFSISP